MGLKRVTKKKDWGNDEREPTKVKIAGDEGKEKKDEDQNRHTSSD